MSTFAKHDTYLSNKLYIPMVYNGTKFVPCLAYIMNKAFTQFYTADREAFITADGNRFMVIGDDEPDVDVRTMARVGEGVVGYSIIGMG